MNNTITPGDYISYVNDKKKQSYGVVLELPVSTSPEIQIRESRGIMPSSYIIRCDHEEKFCWAGHAEYYADKYHFDRIKKNDIIALFAKAPDHILAIGDRVYSKEFHSIGTIRDIDAHAPEYAIEFDWNLNGEEWFPEGTKLHDCDGSIPSRRGWWCYQEDIMWIPLSLYQTLYLDSTLLQKMMKPMENPLRAIFKMAAERRNYG